MAQKIKTTMDSKKWASSIKVARMGGSPSLSSAYSVIPADKKDGLGKIKASVGTIYNKL